MEINMLVISIFSIMHNTEICTLKDETKMLIKFEENAISTEQASSRVLMDP